MRYIVFVDFPSLSRSLHTSYTLEEMFVPFLGRLLTLISGSLYRFSKFLSPRKKMPALMPQTPHKDDLDET